MNEPVDEDGMHTCGSEDIESVPIYTGSDDDMPVAWARYCNGCSKSWTIDEHNDLVQLVNGRYERIS